MHRRHRYARVVREAAERLGSESALAGFFGVSDDQLSRWADGLEPVPFEAFVAGLDVVSRGPFARRRRIRVGAYADVSRLK